MLAGCSTAKHTQTAVLHLSVHAGVSTLNPDSFYHTKESLVLALHQLYAAFKSSHPQMAKALSLAKNEVEDVGLFDSM